MAETERSSASHTRSAGTSVAPRRPQRVGSTPLTSTDSRSAPFRPSAIFSRSALRSPIIMPSWVFTSCMMATSISLPPTRMDRVRTGP